MVLMVKLTSSHKDDACQVSSHPRHKEDFDGLDKIRMLEFLPSGRWPTNVDLKK